MHSAADDQLLNAKGRSIISISSLLVESLFVEEKKKWSSFTLCSAKKMLSAEYVSILKERRCVLRGISCDKINQQQLVKYPSDSKALSIRGSDRATLTMRLVR